MGDVSGELRFRCNHFVLFVTYISHLRRNPLLSLENFFMHENRYYVVLFLSFYDRYIYELLYFVMPF